MQDIFLLIN